MTKRDLDNLENLIDRLSQDSAWRKKELSDLKTLIESKSLSFGRHNAILRSGVTILYAHWEGFVKTSASSYLEFVAMQKLRYEELSSNFVALAMKAKLDQAMETNKPTIFTEVTEFIMTKMAERSSIPYKNVIKTGSNLSSSILREIICILGLDYSFFETKQVIIDEKLLKNRNTIAHGEYLLLDREAYLELHSQVIEMMDNFRTQIENCAAMKSYSRK
ncbi:hypothetical protein I8748_18000 [Nostoc sp. CENA67]|uniref:MAE-28990/MAE-18760-like HEPN domain-containing protein n=1 Tax=Amazonocrinis nigriterrae CENA67 TaxID=2794033 RepID=A0A8J7L998_9NOST|nr:MAE_28990/MAE_18760 family HEPN-like nuclease [Amazonocrinis nigriterrae]MBH8564055.1 hypothetical protein [Amazonocrinis nigriterrae CENA67]